MECVGQMAFSEQLPVKLWYDVEIISTLQRHVIIHSIIYYELNDSVISDKMFDRLLYELWLKQTTIPFKKIIEYTSYYYATKNITPHTSYDVYNILNEEDKEKLMKQANYILKLYRSENKCE